MLNLGKMTHMPNLRVWKNLKKINITHLYLQSDDLLVIKDSKKHRHLTSLIMRDCNLREVPCLSQVRELNVPFIISSIINFDFRAGFENLERLTLSNCGLQTVPNLSHLPNLKYLDIGHNSISQMDFTHADPLKLMGLCLIGNPVEVIDINPNELPHLRSIHFGSMATRFVSSSVLERIARNQIDLSIHDEFHHSLIVPPYVLLKPLCAG